MTSIGDSGHSNRVYCAKFYKDDDTKLVSGGWDNKIVFWDLKAGGKPVHTIHNRLICGDAIDILKEGLMISVAWQDKDQIQMYDINTYRISTNYSGDKGIDWDPAPTNKRGRKKKKVEEPKDGMPKTTYLCTAKADRQGK